MFWCLTGGAAFWLPIIVLSAAFGDRVGLVALNMAPLVALQLLDILSRIRGKNFPQWGWVLAGIYIIGPLAIEVAGFVAGDLALINQWDWLWFILFALLPPLTLWFAALNGMLISVLLATLLLILLEGLRQDRNREKVA
jgi:hypothetical protein